MAYKHDIKTQFFLIILILNLSKLNCNEREYFVFKRTKKKKKKHVYSPFARSSFYSVISYEIE